MPGDRIKRAVVIGDGSWGTTLALVLQRAGVKTCLWSAFPEQANEMASRRENRKFLPGIRLPDELEIHADPFTAAADVDLAVSVVPTQYLREVAARFEDALAGDVPIVSGTKGIEIETFRTPSFILAEVLGDRPSAVLAGPSHAEEVAQGLPASVVCASADGELAQRVQEAFSGDTFRVYTHADPLGAELGGALKNVIALAAGASDGLGLGDNAKSALVTRGMMEMARFGKLLGADPATFFGLSGFGDLVTTCCSQHSRNRRVGEEIGKGRSLAEILEGMSSVAEGVWTTKALFGPEAEGRAVSMPIAEQVHAVLFENKDPGAAVTDLMRRAPTVEMDGLIRELA